MRRQRRAGGACADIDLKRAALRVGGRREADARVQRAVAPDVAMIVCAGRRRRSARPRDGARGIRPATGDCAASDDGYIADLATAARLVIEVTVRSATAPVR